MIKFFPEISGQDINTCGGKGASLGEMTQAGFQVPPGFVVTTEAYQKHSSLWSTQVYDAFDLLGCKLVAVRSSGTKEDGNIDSFAGQFETYLFVNREQLLEKILACHHSLQSERIQSYCLSKGINPDEIKVAVVVQKMVNSDAAGVCFTINPVTNETHEIMIEAGYGIGEAVVSGLITPDNYIIHKETQQLQKSIAQQEKKLILDTSQGGLLEDAVEITLQHIQKISDDHIMDLGKLACKIERYYGQPMDIERAIENNCIYILQARPITTLGVLEETTPFFTIPRLKTGKFELVASRPMTFQRDEMIATCYAQYANIDRLSINIDNNNRSFYSSTEQINTQYQRIFEEIFLDTIGRKKHSAGYIQLQQDIQKLFIPYETLQYYNNKDLIHYFQEWQKILSQFGPFVVAPFVVERIVDPFVRDILINEYGEKLGLEYLGLASSPTEYTQYQLMRKDICQMKIQNKYHLKKLVKRYSRYSEYVFTEKLLDEEYFQQELEKISLEDAKAEYEEITHTIEENKIAYQNMTAIITNQEILHWLDVINRYVFLRTDRVDLLKQVQIWIRGFYKVIANKTERNYDDVLCMSNNEIINVLANDIIPPSNIIAERQPKNYIIYYHQNQQTIFTEQTIVRHIVATIEKSLYQDTNSIQGLSAYPGMAQGRAKKIFSREDITKIQEGDILIARHTMVDYTPAMRRAAAFVTDEGGITSHAAIIARELRKPCVLGCKVAMKQIEDGDLIEVNADNGHVRILHSYKDDIAYFKTKQVSYEGGRACYRIMNYGLNASYLSKNLFEDLLNDFSLISYATPENTQRYRSLDNDKTNDYSFQLQMEGNDLITKSHTHIDSLRELAKGLFSFHRDIKHYLVGDLKKLYLEYLDIYRQLGANAPILRLIDRGIIRAVRRYNPEQADEILSLISIPLQLTHGQEEEKAIAHVARYMIEHNIQDSGKVIKQIQALVDHFGRSSLGYYNEKAKDMLFYKNLFTGNLQYIIDQYQQKYDSYQQEINHRALFLQESDEELTTIAYFAQQAARVKDHYKFSINYIQYLAEPLWEKISIVTNLSIDICKHLMPEEMIALLEGKGIHIQTIQDRIDCCVMYTRDENLGVLGGKQAKEFYEAIILPTQYLGGSERSGRIACKGITTGKVKIVLGPDDFWKIKQGDILVVTNTSPDFVVLFDRISGIIAEEGGITAHVSVVSREYRIPCIVGVHHITKILKDGDIISLDANLGKISKVV